MKKTAVLFVVAVLFCPGIAPASDFRFSPRPNRAHLVQWRNWSREVFSEAKQKDRLILLSLSAVWCHWCHVMDETTYSDPEVISYINDNFIPVRVDANIRPDIDALYNQGGWPSTAILTSQGEVISGGNYFPPQEMLGRLKRAVATMGSNRAAIDSRIEEMKALKELRQARQAVTEGLPDKGTIDDILRLVKDSFDERYGGFGSGQKFPSPDTVDFLLAVYARQKDQEILNIVTATLDHMAEGKLFDAVEGGFFRYATKPDWSEPHYEKLLDVNAGMIKNYADAFLVTGKKEYVRIVENTARYVQIHLYDAATGAFFGSQDADESYYGRPDRKGLQAPAIDETVYADSSSLMISALVSAYGATGNVQYLDMAITAGDYDLENLSAGNDGVYHFLRDKRPGLTGMLLDNALFGSALLDLYNATGKQNYLSRAGMIGQIILRQFFDPRSRRFRSSLGSVGVKPVTAGALADLDDDTANYRAVRFLKRLAYQSRDREGTDIVEAVLAALSSSYRRSAPYAPSFGIALQWALEDPVEITILADGERMRKYLRATAEVYVGVKVVRILSLINDRKEIKSFGYKVRESAYLCVGKKCSKPVTNPERLRLELKSLVESSG